MGLALRTSGAVLVAAGLIALSGCGGDDEKKSASTPADTATTKSETAKTETATAPQTIAKTDATPPPSDTKGDHKTGGATSPEDKPGGAGDEVPNSTQAQLTGRNGKIFPSTVSVPPFIAITVVLTGVDGKPYELHGAGKTIQSGQSVSFDGLRSGKRLVLTGPQGTVVIAANAEPGP